MYDLITDSGILQCQNDLLLGTAAGILYMGLAGEKAFNEAGNRGSGSFRTALIDQIYNTSGKNIEENAKIFER